MFMAATKQIRSLQTSIAEFPSISRATSSNSINITFFPPSFAKKRSVPLKELSKYCGAITAIRSTRLSTNPCSTNCLMISSPAFDVERRWVFNKTSTDFEVRPEFIVFFLMIPCNGVQREHNKKLNNGLPILHKVPPKRDYGRYFCIMAEKGGTSHGGLTEKLSPFFHAKKQEVNAYGR